MFAKNIVIDILNEKISREQLKKLAANTFIDMKNVSLMLSLD